MPAVSEPSPAHRDSNSALIAGLAAFLTWGLVPVYWKLLKSVPAAEILAHRFIWTTLFLVLLLTWQRRWAEVTRNVRTRRALLYCLTSGAMIAINWLVFIWAVNAGRIIETSLGYFMTPLVNVLLGRLLLRERLTRTQAIAVSLAALAVLFLTFGYGRFPWVALVLCATFGLYGFLRKQSGTRPIPGLFLETILLTPVAAAYLFLLQERGTLLFGPSHLYLSGLLASTGVVTSLPLVWFGHAARHLRLVTIGFLQYLSPSCSFFLGVFLYHETFTWGHLITFILIWIGLALFTAEAMLRWRDAREARIGGLADPIIQAKA
jgi:chloramphenicol-sensitive protein RarD